MTNTQEQVTVEVKENSSWDLLLNVAENYKKELKEAEKREALRSPKNAYYYALKVIRGPWEEGESVIAQSAEWSYKYAWLVLKKRFPRGEAAIAKDKIYAYDYVKMFKDQDNSQNN